MAEPLVKPGSTIKLKERNPADSGGLKKEDTASIVADYQRRMCELQGLLYAASDQALLIILQGIDTSGKDGTTNHVLAAVNVTGCRIVGFKQPSAEELAHDYLWRIHQQLPRRGELVVFNRSHYESVLVERVRKLVPEERWRARYAEINNFEQMLTNEGTIILKFFLHISKAEQERRLRERMTDPAKRWKVAPSDWAERAYWDTYQSAFEEMVNQTSSPHAPWYVIPADKKWYRNYLVGKLVVSQLEQYRPRWQAALDRRGNANLKALADAGVKLADRC